MTYRHTSGFIGAQPIAETSTTQKHNVGLICKAYDSSFGEGEFIYLPGVASTVVGSVVRYNTTSFTTALGIAAPNLPQPVAVAMSANVANQWGWYQIGGIAVAAKSSATSLAANAALGLLTTATGLVVGSISAGQEIQGALVAAVASAAAGRTTVQIVVNRPTMQGRIT